MEAIFIQIYADHERIDILINNAGLGIFHLAEDFREADINKMIDINLKGTIYCTQQVLPKMKAYKDIADIIIGNMAYRNKLNVKEVVIKNK